LFEKMTAIVIIAQSINVIIVAYAIFLVVLLINKPPFIY